MTTKGKRKHKKAPKTVYRTISGARVYDKKALAKLLKRSKNWLDTLPANGAPCKLDGRRYVFPHGKLCKWLDSNGFKKDAATLRASYKKAKGAKPVKKRDKTTPQLGPSSANGAKHLALRHHEKKVTDAEREKQKRAAGATRQRRHVAKGAEVGPLPAVENKRRRARCKKDLKRFMRTYMPGSFYRPFNEDQVQAIDAIETRMLKTGLKAVAMARGFGKTTTTEAAIIWAVLYGHRRYVVAIGKTQEDANEIITDIKAELATNEKLAADFPEVCHCVEAIDGRPQRCASQTLDGVLTRLAWKTKKLVMPFVPGSASAGHVIEARGITSGVRGLKHKTPSGQVIRPDFAFIDDPQTRESAESKTQTKSRAKIINGDVLGLAGHDKQISAVMAVTVIEPGDLADQYLDKEVHPEWDGMRTKLVYAWPTSEDLWKQYTALWTADQADGLSDTPNATKFYRKHRKAMDEGAHVACPHLYDKDTELSAVQHAWNLLLTVGEHAFCAEYQNEPPKQTFNVYTLNEECIKQRIDTGRQPMAVPDWVQTTIAATDVNPSYALSTVVLGFGAFQRGGVLWYGRFTSDPLPVLPETKEIETRRIIHEALAAHGKELAALPCRANHWIIDGGGSPQNVVINFAHMAPQICGLQASCAFGRGWKQYRITRKKEYKVRLGENLHRVAESNARQWIIWHADYWREIAQKSWLGAAGGPGSCSLFEGHHERFATQVCGETLRGKDEVAGEIVWLWDTASGQHDYGDCMAMGFMGAAMLGIGTGAYQPPKRPPKRPRRKPKVELDF